MDIGVTVIVVVAVVARSMTVCTAGSMEKPFEENLAKNSYTDPSTNSDARRVIMFFLFLKESILSLFLKESILFFWMVIFLKKSTLVFKKSMTVSCMRVC